MYDLDNSKYAKRAMELFRAGYNCSQSLLGAFAGDFNIDLSFALKLSSGFGGGMGRLRETCGAVTGGIMVLSLKYGYCHVDAYDEKSKLYKIVQDFVADFKSELGTSICRELLNTTDNNPVPTKRTDDFYLKRPCANYIGIGACIVERYLNL